jgi:hypothetical protein
MKFFTTLTVIMGLTYVNGLEILHNQLSGDRRILTVVEDIDDLCGTQKIVTRPYEPLCLDEASSEGPVCRYIELDKPSCRELPCSGDLKMKLTLNTETPKGNCCNRCTCYGDPHCESFSGYQDTWVLCDARNYNTRRNNCPLSKNICKKQKDYYGNNCVWKKSKKGKKWNVGLLGSQCTSNGPDPHLLMYSADDFSIDLTMGERAIITDVDTRLDGVDFHLNAEKCFDEVDPWTPFNPTTFQREVLSNKDVRWIVEDSLTGISVWILCTRNTIGTETGPARINVEDVIEPVDPNSRSNPTGFCFDDVLDKGLSHDSVRTKKIHEEELCQGDYNSERVKIGKVLCGSGTSPQTIDECLDNWCNNIFVDSDKCLQHIVDHGIRRTWCAANTLLTGDAGQCVGLCKECYNELGDFGVKNGMLKWGNFLSDQKRPCLTLNDLPETLEECQDGITIQYKELDEWISYKSIPEGRTLCPDVTFTSSLNPILFNKQLRLEQCSGTCLINKCKPEQGFSAIFSYEKAPDMCPCVEQ